MTDPKTVRRETSVTHVVEWTGPASADDVLEAVRALKMSDLEPVRLVCPGDGYADFMQKISAVVGFHPRGEFCGLKVQRGSSDAWRVETAPTTRADDVSGV